MRVRKVVHKRKVKIISPEREDKKVKTRNESKETNFMTLVASGIKIRNTYPTITQ